MSLSLATEVEERLKIEASQEGVTPEQYATKVLDEHFATAAREKADKLAELFRQWQAEDVPEHEALDDEFFQMLDEDRPSERKLFPPELKGISW